MPLSSNPEGTATRLSVFGREEHYIDAVIGICESCGETPPSLRWKYPELQKKKKDDKKHEDESLEKGAETNKKQARRRSQPDLATGEQEDTGARQKPGKRLEKRHTQMSFDYQVTREQSFCGKMS